MDIVKQITFLLWVLGVILIAPPVLRYFDIDVKQVYSKVLAVDTKDTQTRDAKSDDDGPVKKEEIDPHIFEELFQEQQPETPAQRAEAEKEFKELIAGLERVGAVVPPKEAPVQGVPAQFRPAPNPQQKVRWMPPPPGFLTAETFNYLIYRESHPVGEELKTVLDTIHGNLMLDLTPFTLVAKPNKILVMLFKDKESYMGFTKRPPWSGAASDLKADTMYVLEGRNFYPLSVHELTHLYFDGYFLPAISPLWLSEGMAVYMQIHATKQKPSWVDNSLRSILSGKYIELENMMQMEDLSALTSAQAEIWYTQAYSLVDYLLNERTRDEFYRFCNELKAGAPVHQALYRAYGMPFTKVSVLQNVWLHDLAKHSEGHLFLNKKNIPATVLSSTQTIAVPTGKPQTQPTQAQVQRSQNTASSGQGQQKTVIPKLKMVETNSYRGSF